MNVLRAGIAKHQQAGRSPSTSAARETGSNLSDESTAMLSLARADFVNPAQDNGQLGA